MFLVRLRAGLVRESRRVVHTVPVLDTDAIPATLIAYCGAIIEPGTAELLDGPTGMPCLGCLLATPLPDTPNPLTQH